MNVFFFFHKTKNNLNRTMTYSAHKSVKEFKFDEAAGAKILFESVFLFLFSIT